MRGVEGKEGKRRFGISYVLLVLTILIYLCAWGYTVFAAGWKARSEAPQIDPIVKIIRGLREYQQKTAAFPQTFNQVEAIVWKHPNPPPYGAGGHTLVLKNYYYLYSFISPTRCTLWAIPVGAIAKEAPSYFLVIAPTERKKFKGPALDLKQASTITGEPTYTQLALLGMIQQNDPPPKNR